MRHPAHSSFDALVVGAGPAGSAAAILLAQAGWSVALVERQPFPRRKVCGECIAASNLPLLQTLGVGDAVQAAAGPVLRQVRLLQSGHAVTADLPAAAHELHPWGVALGRDTLDGLLLDRARAVGASVFQPWALRDTLGVPGAWHCELRATDSTTLLRLRARLVVDAHGSWEDLPSERRPGPQARSASDLLAFKAQFTGTALDGHAISVLALDGGYGGMVLMAEGVCTVACCIRRDRLSALRTAHPGKSAGEVVDAWLRTSCTGLHQALAGALRMGPWLTAGPLDPGVRIAAGQTTFRVGNAAGEAHPILGEGMSMALQSAALLCAQLLRPGADTPVPDATQQAALQRRYAAAWRRAFVPRLRLAAAFAHIAMRPVPAAALLRLAKAWPGLLTRGARWGGKVRLASP